MSVSYTHLDVYKRQAERRRRAAARARRKKEIRRNRIIFAILCLALLALIVFGMVKLVGLFTKDKDLSLIHI